MERLADLAIAIADNTCRADIETYAQGNDRFPTVYDVSRPVRYGKDHVVHAEDDAHAVETAQRAAAYIRQRGDALPFVMVELGPNLVRFEDRDSAP